jgi:error-prone DNA polymerase
MPRQPAQRRGVGQYSAQALVQIGALTQVGDVTERLLRARRFKRSSELRDLKHGTRVAFAGLVTMRQRPQTASGVTFITLEDEDGLVNAVIWQHVAERQRREFLESKLMAIEGRMEHADGVQHLIATRLENLTPLLSGLTTTSRDFH